MRILVAQMTRMGDMLQTSPLIRSLRQAHPDAHIAAMVRRMGKFIAERHPDIDEIIIYDEDEMFRNLRSGDSEKLLAAYERAVAYVDQIRGGRYDVVYNCTQSIGSAMLLKLAEVPKVVGAHLSEDWQFVLRGRWTNYFFASVYNREYCDLNLCDVFRNLPEDPGECQALVFDIQDQDRAAAQSLLQESGIAPGDPYICMQLGASENAKRWPEYRFAELARLIREQTGAHVVLVGVDAEAALGERFGEHQPGLFAPLFGKTSIPELAALLGGAQLLVTNDTGTMHIASAANCPVVLVSVGPVHFRETGPYGVGHVAVEQRREFLMAGDERSVDPRERGAIRAEQVLFAVQGVLERASSGEAAEECAGLDDVVLYRSDFAPDGCLEWYPALRRPLLEADFLRIAYRCMWLAFMKQGYSEEQERASLEAMLRCYDDAAQGGPGQWGEEASNAFAGLGALAGQGVQETEQLIEALSGQRDLAKAQEVVSGLSQLDESIRIHGEVHRATRPLAAIARFERDNLEGTEALLVAQSTLQIYRDLLVRAELMREKLETVCGIWRELNSD